MFHRTTAVHSARASGSPPHREPSRLASLARLQSTGRGRGSCGPCRCAACAVEQGEPSAGHHGRDVRGVRVGGAAQRHACRDVLAELVGVGCSPYGLSVGLAKSQGAVRLGVARPELGGRELSETAWPFRLACCASVPRAFDASARLGGRNSESIAPSTSTIHTSRSSQPYDLDSFIF